MLSFYNSVYLHKNSILKQNHIKQPLKVLCFIKGKYKKHLGNTYFVSVPSDHDTLLWYII